MDPPPSGACAQCGKDTTIRCSGCISGPDYVAGDALDVFPCSKSCQTQHRPTHKTYCIRIKKRKELVRAGRLLKSAFITYKEIFYEHEIIRTSLENGVLTLHVPPRAVGDSSLRGSWGPFPDDVPSNITEKEAALCFSQCTAAVAILGPMSRKLLSGTGWSMILIKGKLGQPVFRITFSALNPNAPVEWHDAIRVRHSTSEEIFIIDPCGAQFGISKPCMPFSEYQDNYRCDWVMSNPYDYKEMTDIDLILNRQCLPIVAHAYHSNPACMADVRLERRTRVQFADFISRREGLDKTMLGGSDADFERKMNDFIADLKNHLNGFDW